MDDDVQARIAQLFGEAPAAPRLSKQELLTQKLRDARELEMRRIASQDLAMAQIRALAEAAGIEVQVSAPPSPLRAKKTRAGRHVR